MKYIMTVALIASITMVSCKKEYCYKCSVIGGTDEACTTNKNEYDFATSSQILPDCPK